ncbi:MAG: hypothetical protein KDA79_16080, partial [Planctomycetaceae bacterium]|nr:hypothetical protein [Planctomycetaceae bacterium]
MRTHVQGQQPSPADENSAGTQSREEESPLLREPQTVEQHFDAAVLMLKLARPGLTRRYLQGMMELNPDDGQLLLLRDKHGPAIFLKLANVQELRPLSTQLLDRINQAFRQRGTDPKRIRSLLDDLSANAQKRDVALVALQAGGPGVVPQILREIQQTADGKQRDLLIYALTRLGPQVVSPLLGGLHTPDENLKTAVIEALGWTGGREVAVFLWHPAFGPDQPAGVQMAARTALGRILQVPASEITRTAESSVAGELHRMAMIHYRNQFDWTRPGAAAGKPEPGAEKAGQVEMWTWSPEAESIVKIRLPEREASLYTGARFARQTLAFSPEKKEAQALYLGMALAIEASQAGWDQPLPAGPGTAHDLALTTGAEVIGTALDQALSNQNPLVATAAIRVLGQVATRHQLNHSTPAGAPLLAALNYPDMRVQFAAAESILQLDPVRSFRGSRRTIDILTQAVNGGGAPQSLVVDANVQRASRASGFMAEMGYDPQIARTGRDGFELAAERGDVQLILLHANTIRWELTQTIANLRADARTAGIPIAVYGEASLQADIEPLTRRYPMVTFVIDSATVDALRGQLQPFLDGMKSPMLTERERGEIRQRAIYWLAHLASGRRTEVFDVAPAQN